LLLFCVLLLIADDTSPEKGRSATVVIKHNASEVLKILQHGFVPVLHGDCVFDTNSQQKVNILSGDLIVHTLAKEFRCTNVVFACDVKVSPPSLALPFSPTHYFFADMNGILFGDYIVCY
jgi:hypothetical protein